MKPHPAHSILSGMENDLLAIRRWAAVLDHLGCSPHAVQPEELYVLAGAIRNLGLSLEGDWKDALDAMRREP